MKKVLTAMTAMTLTLQANTNLNQEYQDSDTNIDNFKDHIDNLYYNESFIETMGLSNNEVVEGSFPVIDFHKTVELKVDADESGTVTEGDILLYDLICNNTESINASGLFLEDILDENVTLVNSSVNTTLGSVVVGNNSSDSHVEVNIGELEQKSMSIVSFEAVVGSIPEGESIDIINQAFITSENMGSFISDDPNVNNIPTDPTVIQAFGSEIADDLFENGFE